MSGANKNPLSHAGAAWLNRFPSRWDVVRLKSAVRVRSLKRNVVPEDRYVGLEHVESWTGQVRDSEDSTANAEGLGVVFEAGDVLLGKLRPYLAKVFLADRPGIASTEFLALQGVHVEPEFLRYCLVSEPFIGAVVAATYGAKMPRANWEDIGNSPQVIPPRQEQRAIADFLDRETAKIDALIATQERLIALLDEKRQATITHAVTKGLNPDAPMKESGVEWIGDVPEGWERLRLKRVLRSSDYGISDALDAPDGVAVLRMSNIKGGQVVIDDLKYVSSVPSRLLLNINDLLFNRTNSLDLVGQVGMVRQILDHDMSFASYLVRLRTTIRARPAYLGYLLNHPELLRLVRSMAFAAIGQANLNPTRYAEIVLLLPAVAEQDDIVACLDGQTAKIDDLAAKAAQAIERLRERRAALITAAVTGQIDVTRPAITEAAE